MHANIGKQVVPLDASSCRSAPPLTSTHRILLPPRLTTSAEEARRPRAPLHAIKREVRESEPDSVEVVDEDDEQDKDEPVPHRPCVRLAAVAVRQPATTAREKPQGPPLNPSTPRPRRSGIPRPPNNSSYA